ncbi:MAG TPA: alpha/beta fold hydrolase [Roseiarcus sp.]
MDDLRAVMDAVGVERAALFGISKGGSLAALFAASHPERSQSLVLYGAFARFRHWMATDEAFDGLMKYMDEAWAAARVCQPSPPRRRTMRRCRSGGANSNGLAPVPPRRLR